MDIILFLELQNVTNNNLYLINEILSVESMNDSTEFPGIIYRLKIYLNLC